MSRATTHFFRWLEFITYIRTLRFAKEFAAKGAKVFLAGRTKATVDAAAKEIAARAAGRTPLQSTAPITPPLTNSSPIS